jgi:tetratricopeptide (TPR) repeat protein
LAIYIIPRARERRPFPISRALGIASSFNWHDHLFWAHYALAELFLDEGRFDDAHAHVERAKSHAVNNAYYLGRAMELQARVWYKQHRLEEARSEALRAADVYEKLGAAHQQVVESPISPDGAGDRSASQTRAYNELHFVLGSPDGNCNGLYILAPLA